MNYIDCLDDFNRLLYENKCYNAISCGFSWDDTVEGFDFWSDLNDNWHYYRNNLIKTEFND